MGKKTFFKPDAIDAEPINVFSLPQEIMTALEPVSDQKSSTVVDDVVAMHKQQERLNQATLEKLHIQQQNEDKEKNDNEIDNAFSCGTCQQVFSDRQEHRQHFGTNWHRYNIKRKLMFDQHPVSSSEFEDMLADLTDSLSGSESDRDESDEDSDNVNDKSIRGDSGLDTIDEEDKVATLVGKQQLELTETQAIEDQVTATASQWAAAAKTPLQQKYSSVTWFTVPSLTKVPFHLGVYRVLLESRKNVSSSLDAVQQIQQPTNQSSPRLWTLLMMGGGHFAGAIVDVGQSKGLAEQQLSKQVNILTHKTFHRYTTRRKQGGSQSANDNGKGKANSAGAQIRRYNEMALQQDIRELLSQWKKYIDQSELVFVQAPSGNKKIIYGYDGAVLRKDNPRIHNMPFTTRRPTLSELRRVYLELTTLKVIQVDEQSLLQHQQQLKEKENRLRQRLEKTIAKSADDNKQDRTTVKDNKDPVLDKLLVLVKQGKVNVIQSYLEKHPGLPIIDSLPSSFIDGAGAYDYRRYPTVLHIAASQGHADVVAMLLGDMEANPTVKNDIGKTAYEVSKDKITRNVFRRCMCDHPDRWQWLDDAHVPSPLTAAEEQEQLEKDRKRKAKEDERKRLIELDRQQKEDARLAKEEAEILEARAMAANSRGKKKLATSGGVHTLDPMARALRDNHVNVANMSPEARMRLEREKRARAAEERLKKK